MSDETAEPGTTARHAMTDVGDLLAKVEVQPESTIALTRRLAAPD